MSPWQQWRLFVTRMLCHSCAPLPPSTNVHNSAIPVICRRLAQSTQPLRPLSQPAGKPLVCPTLVNLSLPSSNAEWKVQRANISLTHHSEFGINPSPKFSAYNYTVGWCAPLRYFMYAHLPVLPPSIVAACQGQIHAFDSQDLIDVYIPDGPETVIYRCEQQPCPNRTPRSIAEDYPRYKAIRRAQHPLGPRSTLASRSASRHSRPVSPTSRLPQTVAESSQARGDLPPDPAPEPEPEEGDSEEGVSESESADPARPASPTALAPASAVPDVRNPPAELPAAPSPPTPPRGRSSTRSSRSSTSGRPPQPPLPPQRPPSPPTPIMSSPSTAPDKETLKLLLPLRYDSKTVIECDRFLSQLRIYWLINTSVAT
ncbi:predicted protein [Postia placenta Mad-698-R]|nr:predicted protein [Postia placenta Mad-698-R]